MSYTKMSDICIHETTDYSQFKFYNSNRDVTINKTLERNILETNLLQYHPILVNHDMMVVDGQHRLDIAQKHKLPVYFIIGEFEEKNVVEVNIGRKNWVQSDFVNFYAKQGISDYIKLKKLHETYGINYTLLIDWCGRGRKKINFDNSDMRNFRSGKFSFKKDFEVMDNIISKFIEIRELFVFYTGTKRIHLSLERFIIKMIDNDDYDHDRFIKTLKHNPENMIKALGFYRAESLNRVLVEETYNKRFHSPNRLKIIGEE